MRPDAERVPELDGIRGLAIIQVMVWHFRAWVPAEPGSPVAHLLRTLSLTWSGVDLFFVLSGFLIGGILIDNRNSANYFRVFYARRFFRIVPLYLLLLGAGLLLAASGRIDETVEGVFISLPWYLSFTQNFWMAFNSTWHLWFGQTWSLAVEEQFYLLLPLLVLATSPRNLPKILLGLVGVAVVFPFVTFLGTPLTQGAIANHVLLPARMDSLFIGALAAWAVRIPGVSHWLRDN